VIETPELTTTPPPPSEEVGATGDWVRLGIMGALVVLLGVTAGWAWPAVIFGFIFMIFMHELGHYLTAKWSGMKVTEFFFGFGPRLWSFRRGETEYGVKPFLVGAYVRIIGMSTLEEVDEHDEPRSYRAQSFPRRLAVVCAGSTMHMLMAFVLLVAVMMHGIPGGTVFGNSAAELDRIRMTSTHWTIATVSKGSAAAAAGIKPGDDLVALGGHEIKTFQDMREAVVDHGNEKVAIAYVHDGKRIERTVKLGVRPDDKKVGFLGVSPNIALPSEGRNPVAAVGAAGKEVGLGVKAAVGALGSFFSAHGLNDYASQVREGNGDSAANTPAGGTSAKPERQPGENRLLSIVGALRLGASAAESGWLILALFFIQINIFIGLINMVPLLPFDGGHAAVAIYERVRSRRGRTYRVNMEKLLPLTYGVVLLLGAIFVTSLYLDIVNPIG
jgi:membrane-associated protease RseP (regulator of RpoE activity)